jgi:hypothetical protein
MPIPLRARWVWVLACLAAMGSAPTARAGDLFAEGHLGISWGDGETSGSTSVAVNPSGSDVDGSPVYGATFGLAFPMNEMLPPAWDVPLPDWEMRVELEGLYGRDNELATEAGGAMFADFLTETTTWSLMANLWLDLPVYQPVSWLFGRIPILEPMSLFVGSGIGLASTDVDVSNNAFFGSETTYNFAWQAGAGLSYALTDRTTVSIGYRYFDPGDIDLTLTDSVGTPFGRYGLDLHAHELRTALRVEFYSVPFPGAYGGSRFRAR